MSTSNGAWAARIPDVRARVGADDAAWGLANTIGATVNLVAIGVMVAALVGRVDSRKLAVIGAAGILVVMPLLAASTSVGELVVGLCGWFCISCLLGVPSGALQLEVQRRYGRPLMGSFNACFGIGIFVGGGIGTIAAAVGVPADRQFLATSLLLLAALAVTARWLPAEPSPTAANAPRLIKLRDRFTRHLLAVAALAGLAQYVTTTLELWTASYATGSLGVSSAVGAATYTTMTVAGIIGLLGVDRLIDRFGDLLAIRCAAVLAAGGVLVGIAVRPFPAVVAGFVVLSVGMACVGPPISNFAGAQTVVTYSEAVSVMELGDSAGALAAPFLVGTLAATVGLRMSLGSVAVAAIAMAVLAGRAAGTPAARLPVENMSTCGRLRF